MLLPFIVLAALVLWWLWLGRDPRPGTIVPSWNPPDEIRPGPAGALLDQRAGPDDILATILDLARRGWLTIIESHPSGVPAKGGEGARIARVLLESTGAWETEWRFVRTEKTTEGLEPHEGAVFLAIFGGAQEASARMLRATFPVHVPGIQAALYDDLVQKGFFRHSPDHARREWLGLAGLVGAAAITAIVWGGRPALGIALAACAALIVLFAPAMPVPTREGAAMRDRLLGLREYIGRAEKQELEHRHAPERTPELFDELLPWAIALGVSDLWLDEFRTLLPSAPPPPWYAREGAPLETTSFSADLGVFLSASLQVITARN